jgi:RNA polymerase sigma-70 factor (ECF subfamily)
MTPPHDRTVKETPSATLAARSRGADLEAFRRLMEAHMAYSFRVAYGLLHDRDDADDAVQEAFIRVWKHFDRFREEEKFTTWLYRIVVNVSYDTIRARSRRDRIGGYFDRFFGGADPPGGEDPSAGMDGIEAKEMVVRIAKRLPPKQYLVFHLRDLLDLTVGEAAAAAGMSMNAVKVNLCLARKKVRKGLVQMREKHE